MSTKARVLSGRYRIDELIGRGGMATVYRGYDLTLGREIALKILKRELAEDTAFRTRFRLEAQAASRMSHPTIVRVFDAGEDVETTPDGATHPLPYIVMELVPGQLLRDIIAAGPVPQADAVRYVDGILEALEYSHRAGVIHRDIKPGNVMVTDSGQVKVMDFGIARAVSDSSSTVADTTAIIGTAAYFSPEQAKGEPVDARADVYSTGIVLYELLTGRQPFRGETPVAIAYQHVSEAPPAPSEENEGVSRAMDAVVLRALAKDPFQRYPDAAAFRESLDAATDSKEPSKRQLSSMAGDLYGPNPRQAAETARSLRQLATDTTMTRTQAGPPVPWIWAGVAVLAAVLASLFIWVLAIKPTDAVIPVTSRVVPNVTEMTYDRAQEMLAKEELVARRVDEPSATVPEGNVIRTDPGASVTVSPGQEIVVYVSVGLETVKVPSLEGLPLTGAQQALKDAKLTVGVIRTTNDASLGEGTVISADQRPGDKVPEGTTVNLLVASGRVVIDDVTGYTVDAATRKLEDLELTVRETEDPACTSTDPATVASQSVAPGEVPIHSTVTLTVCTGS